MDKLNIKTWYHRIIWKIVAVLLLILFTGCSITAVSLYLNYGLLGDAYTINYAGQERYRFYQLAFLVNRYLTEDIDTRSQSRKLIEDKMAEFRKILYGLRDGDRTLGLKGFKKPKVEHRGERLIANKAELQDIWLRLTHHIDEYEQDIMPFFKWVLDKANTQEAQLILPGYNHFTIPDYVISIDRTVRLISFESTKKVTRVRSFLFICLGVIIAIVITAYLLARRFLERPIRELHRGIQDFMKGNLTHKIPPRTKDEIGEVANSFNVMAEELTKRHDMLQEASIKDALTGLYNYYYFQEFFAVTYENANRYKLPLSYIVMDIDYFKTVNDLWGHPFGDFVLQELARLIKTSIRSSDVASRIGGEEFSIILVNTDINGACKAAQKLMENVRAYVFKKEDMSSRITVTLGIACNRDPDVNSATDIIRYADEALLEGKRRGRNIMVLCTDIKRQKAQTQDALVQEIDECRKKFFSAEESLKRSYIETTLAFLKALETKDNYTAKHSHLVAAISVKLASKMGLSPSEIEVIKNAALLHDIGNIGIPEEILRRNGKLSEEEMAVVKRHPKISVSILENVRLLQREIPIIYYHHERFDGGGYPEGRKSEEIPLGARIISIADAYEAMISDRPYRDKLSKEEAFAEIRKCAGSQFDPALVEPFISAMTETDITKVSV